jgi:hypothetical protein
LGVTRPERGELCGVITPWEEAKDGIPWDEAKLDMPCDEAKEARDMDAESIDEGNDKFE